MDRQPFPIVGVGASAGGVEALEGLFKSMPSDTGAAFVIVTHLSPDRQSVLPEIVARLTSMTVEPARDGVEVRPDNVFVLPEQAVVTLVDGRLRLTKLAPPRRERKPIDIFLSSLAKDRGEYAAGVILSGGDSDGTLGVKAIKERGGLTVAQTSNGTAPKHPDMPNSAIAAGTIDFAIPVEDMAEKIVQFIRGLEMLNGMAAEESLGEAQREIYGLLRNQVGHDFSGYKTKTFNRRVQRRMQVVELDTIEGYVERLRQDTTEVVALFRDLLISVTNFFRDADAFEALKTLVIPKLFEGRGADETVRVWIPGCATGEEVYSVAILMREHMDGLRALPRVQIFATDIDERSLSAGRAGRYPEALMDTVSPERRRRFFTLDGGAYVVTKDVRDLCIFSPHSVIRDPPFSRMDLVSCRNLLIYFGPDMQGQVIPTFHYSLRPNGYLFLGTSENVSQFSDLFQPIEKTHRIFRAREDAHANIRIPMMAGLGRPSNAAEIVRFRKTATGPPLRQTVDAHVMERFAPPHVVVNGEGDVVYYSPRTGKYLEAAPGAPSRQLLAMARKSLRLDLRSALRDTMESHRQVVRQDVALETEDDRVQMVTLTVEPLSERSDEEALFLILFADNGPTLSREDAVIRVRGEHDDVVSHLERELRDTRDRLQSMIEEYETALEELKSSNEELVSVNEELQSTNEELEASKEELQSLNEELQTVNIELGHKVDALDISNGDLKNLFESTQIATVFLDHNLVIRNFTPPAAELFNILPGDRGRPLTNFSGRLVYPGLQKDIVDTLGKDALVERTISRDDAGAHYLARLSPYHGADRDADGVIVTFIDVTGLTEAKAHQQVLIAELNHRVKNMLSIIVSIARQTARSAPSVQAFSQALIGRLEGMARSYDLLSREKWRDTSIEDLVRQALAPFGVDRAEVSGPKVMLKPKQAVSLGMVLHELATNGLKYGALSSPKGGLDVIWAAMDADDVGERIQLTWRERDGPAVAPSPPTGFGLKLVERETAHTLGGAARIAFQPSGLMVDLDFPLV